jgi:glutathione S-transferase
MRNIPFRTVWLDWPDIETEMSKLGVRRTSPTPAEPEGHYTVPTIVDLSNDKAITDSADIYAYIAERYPADSNHPGVSAATAEQQKIVDEILPQISKSAFSLILAKFAKESLTPRGLEFVRRTREKSLGTTLESLAVPADQRPAKLEELRNVIAAASAKIGNGTAFFGGDEPNYADVQVASSLKSLENVAGPESDVRGVLYEADGGRFAKYLGAFAKWEGKEEL